LTLSKDQLFQLKSNGVKKFVISTGTVELAQLLHETLTPKKAATDDDSMPVAKEALTFMVVGVNDSFKVPVGYFLIDDLG